MKSKSYESILGLGIVWHLAQSGRDEIYVPFNLSEDSVLDSITETLTRKISNFATGSGV